MRLHLFVICALSALASRGLAMAGEYVGKPFPEFDATDPMTKKRFQLSDYRGKVVLIDFWATWCGPCRAEIPNVKNVYQQYHDQGFEIISVSLDSDAGKFRSYVNSNNMNWTHVMDGGGWGTRLAKKYGINSIPAMFLLDHNGVCISDSARGANLAPAVERALKNLPGTPAPTNKLNGGTSMKGVAMIDRMRTDLDQLAQQLDAAAAPLRSHQQQLEAARKSLEQAESGSAAAGDSGASCRRLMDEIASLRNVLFAEGILNGNPVLRADLTTAAEAGRAGAAGDIQPCAAKARAALTAMEKDYASAVQQVDDVAARIQGLREQLSTQPITLQEARQKFSKVDADARSQIDRVTDAWKKQLGDGYAMLAPLGDADASPAQQLTVLERSIADCRAKMVTKARSGSNSQVLRDGFEKIRSDVLAAHERVCAPCDGQCTLPKDPYENHATDDPLVRKEVEAQLVEASKLVKQLRSRAAAANEREVKQRASFSARIDMLRSELQQAADDAVTEAVRVRVLALCAEILSAAPRA